jgi:hypothetical protein
MPILENSEYVDFALGNWLIRVKFLVLEKLVGSKLTKGG